MTLSKQLSIVVSLICTGIGAVNATTISGELNIFGSVRVSASKIDFLPVAGGSGLFSVDLFSQTESFLPLAGTTGTSRDLDIAANPVGVPFLLPNFMTFAGQPGLHFDLTFVQPGAGTSAGCASPAAGGQVCAVAGSPFTLSNTSRTSSTAAFNVRGTVSQGSGPILATFVGTYSTQFPTQSLQDVLARLGASGFVQKSFAATFDVTPVAIPEPGTASLLIAGSLLVLVARWKRSSKLKS